MASFLAAVVRPALPADELPVEPGRRSEFTVYPTSKRPRQRLLLPGEWHLISSQRGLWMPHAFAGETRLAFRKRGPEVFVVRGDGKEQLVGVRMGSLSGRPEVRSAVAAGANPLTIWCHPGGIEDLPTLPPGRYHALALEGITEPRTLERFPTVSALRVDVGAGSVDLTPLAKLANLESLWLSCIGVADLRPLAALPKLKVLRLDCGKGLTDLSPLGQLKGLRLLVIDGAENLQDLRPLSQLPELSVLELRRCSSLGDLASVARIRSLTWLGLHGCTLVDDLASLASHPRLEVVELSDCSSVQNLAPLATIPTLEGVTLNRCSSVADLSPLSGLLKLNRVEVVDCPRVADLWPLQGAAQHSGRFTVDSRLDYQVLSMSRTSPSKVTVLMDGCYVDSVSTTPEAFGESNGWVNILSRGCAPSPAVLLQCGRLPYPVGKHKAGSVLDFTLEGARVFLSVDRGPRQLIGVIACSPLGYSTLQEALASGAPELIVWSDAESLASLPPLLPGRQTTLVVLGIRAPLSSLADVANVTALHLEYGCQAASNLSPLAHLTDLKALVIRSTPRVDSLRYLSRLTQLTSLDVALSPRVRDLAPLARLTKLKSLRLACSGPLDFSPLAGLPDLKELTLEGTEACGDLSSLGKLAHLERLALDWKGKPGNLQPLAQLTRLHTLRLANCSQIDDLAPLAGLKGLDVVILRNCTRIRELRALGELPKLRWLDVAGCGKVSDAETLFELHRRGVQLNLDSRLRMLLMSEPVADAPRPVVQATPN